jgi:hypothetical protein
VLIEHGGRLYDVVVNANQDQVIDFHWLLSPFRMLPLARQGQHHGLLQVFVFSWENIKAFTVSRQVITDTLSVNGLIGDRLYHLAPCKLHGNSEQMILCQLICNFI